MHNFSLITFPAFSGLIFPVLQRASLLNKPKLNSCNPGLLMPLFSYIFLKVNSRN